MRSQDERRRHGIVPGSLHIPRSVLEWRVDPDSGYTNPYIATLDCRLVLFCREGFSSSFAAASLRELGHRNATDMVGGFDAWKSSRLPVRSLDEDEERDREELPGMGAPEPLEVKRPRPRGRRGLDRQGHAFNYRVRGTCRFAPFRSAPTHAGTCSRPCPT